MANVTTVSDCLGGGLSELSPSLPEKSRQHLGKLLADVYMRVDPEPGASDHLARLIAKLDAALEQARDRQEVEFRSLLLSTSSALRRFALSLAHDPTAADDLVQDTLLRAWKNRSSFAPGTNFEAWTFTILRNQFYTDRRKHRELQDEDGSRTARLTSPPNQTGRVDLNDLQVALGKMTPVMREALVLVTIEDLSYEQAAAIMECEVGTVKSRVSRGRSQLARLLGYSGSEIGSDAVMLSALVGADGAGE